MLQQLDNLLYLWHQRTLYIGPSYHARQRQYDAAILLIGLEQNFYISSTDGQSVSARISLLTPSKSFSINANDQKIAVLYLDYFGRDFLSLSKKADHCDRGIYYGFDEQLESQVVQLIGELNARALGIESAGKLITFLGLKHHSIANFCTVPDRRLRALINQYLVGELHRNCKVQDAAQAIGLSVPRLGQLFREQLGTTFKSFRNRHLMHCYLLSTAHGKSFSEAAVEAGFVDQSHFCKHFKRKTGLQSTLYIQHRKQQKSFVDPEIADYYKKHYEHGGQYKSEASVIEALR